MKQQQQSNINLFANLGASCYVIKGRNGDLLIDTGFYFTWKKLQKWLSNYQIKHVFLTHAHADHDWNAARMQQNGAQILLHIDDKNLRQAFSAQPVSAIFPKEKVRVAIQKIGTGFLKSTPYEPEIYIKNEDTAVLKTLGYDAEIVMLPGHTLGSMGVLHHDVLYCGDAFTMIHNCPEIAPTGVSIQKMRNSLQRILNINPSWLACGHGAPVRMREARPVIEAFLHEE